MHQLNTLTGTGSRITNKEMYLHLNFRNYFRNWSNKKHRRFCLITLLPEGSTIAITPLGLFLTLRNNK